MKTYELLIGEPWDFESPDGKNRLIVKRLGVRSVRDERNNIVQGLLVELVNPYLITNEMVKYLLLFPRHRINAIEEMENVEDPSKNTVNICRVPLIDTELSTKTMTFWAIGNINSFAA